MITNAPFVLIQVSTIKGKKVLSADFFSDEFAPLLNINTHEEFNQSS